MPPEDDPRLGRFVRGELDDREIAAFEAELDRRPTLRQALLDHARAEGARTATSSGAASRSAVDVLDGPSRLAVGPTLGMGGMGTVRQGVQRNLGRSVAVKTLREETPSGSHRLLQEARLTSRLQHPNIVPVHEIVPGHEGELQIVLKQVEGVAWAKVMHDTTALRERFGAEDLVDWNLHVLVAVCNALAFAHDRGVIHRDIKPSNVMIGSHGEIYVLDWGIAGQFGERTDPELAHVEDMPVAGTLAYMAPEQLEGDPEALGPWTDVYLLGATLYELFARRPPHATANAAVSRARPRERGVPRLDGDVPAELVLLVEQALTPAPEDRLFSVQEFRAAIEAFRSHRGALDLARRAERARSTAMTAREGGDAATFERSLSEAEFGFRAAVEAWPENVRAREGLRAVALDRIEAALADGHLELAEKLARAIADLPAEVSERVARASASEAERRASANRAVWNQDPKIGVAARGVVLAAFAPLWLAGWIGLAVWPGESSLRIVAVLLVYAVVGTGVVLSRGRPFLQNQMNRTNVLGAAVALGSALVWTLASERLALGVTTARLGIILVFTMTPALVAVTSDPRGLVPALLGVGCFAFGGAFPSRSGEALAASAVLLAGSTVVNNIRLRRRMRAAPPPA